MPSVAIAGDGGKIINNRVEQLANNGKNVCHTNAQCKHNRRVHGSPQDFFPVGGGQKRDLKEGSSQQSPGVEPRWKCGAKPLKAGRHFLKLMHKYFVY